MGIRGMAILIMVLLATAGCGGGGDSYDAVMKETLDTTMKNVGY